MNEEIQSLIDDLLERMKEVLVQNETINPFGAYIGIEGQVHPLEFDYDIKNMPKQGTVIESLNKFCSTEFKENKIRGFAIAHQVKYQLTKKEPQKIAIAIEITHIDKDVPMLYYPFTRENGINIEDRFAVK